MCPVGESDRLTSSRLRRDPGPDGRAKPHGFLPYSPVQTYGLPPILTNQFRWTALPDPGSFLFCHCKSKPRTSHDADRCCQEATAAYIGIDADRLNPFENALKKCRDFERMPREAYAASGQAGINSVACLPRFIGDLHLPLSENVPAPKIPVCLHQKPTKTIRRISSCPQQKTASWH